MAQMPASYRLSAPLPAHLSKDLPRQNYRADMAMTLSTPWQKEDIHSTLPENLKK